MIVHIRAVVDGHVLAEYETNVFPGYRAQVNLNRWLIAAVVGQTEGRTFDPWAILELTIKE